MFASYGSEYPDLALEIELMQRREIPPGWDRYLPVFPADAKGLAGLDASGKTLNVLAQNIPWFLGGSSDLGPSNKTLLTFEGAGDFQADTPGGKNLHFGIREHAMAAIVNGLSLSKLRPYGASFFIFSDYARPSMRLAALMELPSLFIFTHDAMGDGEDGPTHQPIEQLSSLRAIPGLVTLRPADANEVVEAYRYIVQLRHEPAVLVLSRQPLPTLDRNKYAPASGVSHGAYVLADASGGNPEAINHRLRKRGQSGCPCPRNAASRRHSLAACLHAVMGDFRATAKDLSEQCPPPSCEGASCCGTGFHLRLGTIRRRRRECYRHEHFRRFGSSQGTAKKVRVRT